MRNLILAIILLAPAFVAAQKTQPDPADYTITVHVQSSRLAMISGDVTNGTSFYQWMQRLEVVIDGKKYELSGSVNPRESKLLRLGDYKARIFREDTKRAYEYSRSYQFLFPDGRTRVYGVVGEESAN